MFIHWLKSKFSSVGNQEPTVTSEKLRPEIQKLWKCSQDAHNDSQKLECQIKELGILVQTEHYRKLAVKLRAQADQYRVQAIRYSVQAYEKCAEIACHRAQIATDPADIFLHRARAADYYVQAYEQ
jgi:hypothetical protein